MIELHRLSLGREPFHLNPDLIERMEASPDCHITLTTGNHLTVLETVEEVADLVRAWRVDVLARAIRSAGLQAAAVA